MGDYLTQESSLLAAQVLAAFLYAGETLHPTQHTILDKGVGHHSITTHQEIPGSTDVVADITMDCGSLKARFNSYGPNSTNYTKDAAAAFDSFIKSGGDISIEHPAAQANAVTIAELTNTFAESALHDNPGISQEEALGLGGAFVDDVIVPGFEDKLVTTEEEQRAFAAENGKQYVVRARLGCVAM